MDDLPDGGQAFPDEYNRGLSIRDWFAGQALAGVVVGILAQAERGTSSDAIADSAYSIADAMIERGKK